MITFFSFFHGKEEMDINVVLYSERKSVSFLDSRSLNNVLHLKRKWTRRIEEGKVE